MSIPFESREALEVAQALGNSALAGERLDTAEELQALMAGWAPYTGRRTYQDDEAREVADIRLQLIQLWDADRDGLAAGANTILAEFGSAPMLVRHDDMDWHIHAVDPDQSLAARIATESAMAFVDLVRADETDRLKRCADQTCRHLFLDESRNRSRRFCSTQCQGRVNVAAFRARNA